MDWIGTAISVASVLIALASFSSQSRRTRMEMHTEFVEGRAITDLKIDNLSNQVEKHNSVIERTYKVEQDLQNLFHRYDELHPLEEVARHASERAEAAHNRLDRAGL